MAFEPRLKWLSPQFNWNVTLQSTRRSLLPWGMSNIALVFVIMIRKRSCLQKHFHHCLSLVSAAHVLCVIFVSCVVVDYVLHPVSSSSSPLASSVFFPFHVAVMLSSVFKSDLSHTVFGLQSPAISFLSFTLFSCRLTCCRPLFTHSASLSITCSFAVCHVSSSLA